jgi:fructose-specific phosphotransferase system IIC component
LQAIPKKRHGQATYGSRENVRSFFFEIALMPWLAAGCSRAPSFDIIGSFFPAWLICLVIGILLAALGRWLLLRQQIAVVWPILVYPSLAALFTFLFWLIFFS